MGIVVDPVNKIMIHCGNPIQYASYDTPYWRAHEVEVSDNTGGCEPEEVAGASPSISRNPMRSIEDMVEQNDNSFDGVINNVKVEPAAGTLEIVPDDKKSVLEKLKEQSKQVLPPVPVSDRKPVPGCCFEREFQGW